MPRFRCYGNVSYRYGVEEVVEADTSFEAMMKAEEIWEGMSREEIGLVDREPDQIEFSSAEEILEGSEGTE